MRIAEPRKRLLSWPQRSIRAGAGGDERQEGRRDAQYQQVSGAPRAEEPFGQESPEADQIPEIGGGGQDTEDELLLIDL